MKIKKIYPILASGIFLSAIMAINFIGISINTTASMKKGIYIKAHGEIKTGDIVLFCLNEPYKTIGLKSGYLEPGLKCNGSAPLIKQVIAIPGDTVVLLDESITVNGTKYPYQTRYLDEASRKISVYPRGVYLSTRGYWLIGTGSSNSWDSRYWGAIDRSQILYKLKPAVIW